MAKPKKNKKSTLFSVIKNSTITFFKSWKWYDFLMIIFGLSTVISISLVSWILWQKDDLISLICSTLGLLTTFLCAKGQKATYYFGIVQTILYSVVCFNNQDYVNFAIYLVIFSIFQFYGLNNWGKNSNELNIVKPKRLSWKVRIIGLIGIFALIFITSVILSAIRNNFSVNIWANGFFDASSAYLATSALLLMILRYEEQWVIWIISDLFQLGMWINNTINGQGSVSLIVMTSILTIFSIYGFINWTIQMKRNDKVKNG